MLTREKLIRWLDMDDPKSKSPVGAGPSAKNTKQKKDEKMIAEREAHVNKKPCSSFLFGGEA